MLEFDGDSRSNGSVNFVGENALLNYIRRSRLAMDGIVGIDGEGRVFALL